MSFSAQVLNCVWKHVQESSGEDKLYSLSSDVIQNALKWKTNSNEQSKILKHSGQLFYV